MAQLAVLPMDCFTLDDLTWHERTPKHKQLLKLVENDRGERERKATAFRRAKLAYLQGRADHCLPMD